jgi:tetratricopeptide (TPR) repeat protein
MHAAQDDVGKAIELLREGIRLLPECAELHFQLGVLLAGRDNCEEAELRFSQALNLDRRHADAMVQLALCLGRRNLPAEAATHLQRAQEIRPHDPRVGFLLAMAARSAREQGQAVRVRATIPVSAVDESKTIDQLVQMIDGEPDLLDALLVLPQAPGNDRLFSLVAQALDRLLGQHPHRADLYFHHARAVERLGRRDQAIVEAEHAVSLDPTLTRALIELGRLYELSNRPVDAISRLERAADAGAAYADVYYRLGNLYRSRGETSQARGAYHRALALNRDYVAAEAALQSLPA